ncbi:MAG: CvpA family protein [Candidatus Gottesmanbacteria bacterium]|nr:CvpA family protein [Candidatus Gottesmanbacteria bacterium]
MMQFNWIDWLIVIIVLYQVIEGWDKGIVSLLSNTLAFLVSLWIAIRFHVQVGGFLIQKFGLPQLWTNVLGYLVLAFPAEMVVNSILEWPMRKIPQKIVGSIINKWLGSVFAVVNALLFVSFLLLIVLAIPSRGTVKRDIKNSRIGSQLVLASERYGGKVKSSLDSVTQEAMKFVTIKPKSQERLDLDVAPEKNQLTVDNPSELQMVALVNEERSKIGLGELRIDEQLTDTARRHSRDMFERRYFSHFSPEGHDVSYRAKQSGIEYSLIGENLAYAPNVSTAHTGFMNSEGHRKNILDGQWSRIGIGTIDGDVYGKMFTQVFAN